MTTAPTSLMRGGCGGSRLQFFASRVFESAMRYTWQTATKADIEGIVRESFDTNVFRRLADDQGICAADATPSMGRIVNVSSGAGSLTSLCLKPFSLSPAYSSDWVVGLSLRTMVSIANQP
jgi:hypothetical protein